MILNRATFRIAAALSATVIGSLSLHAQEATTLQTEQARLQAARQNIEKYRKSDATLTLLDRQGAPLEGLKVEINQVTQDFLFGNTAFDLARANSSENPAFDSFKARYKALFNYGVLPFYWYVSDVSIDEVAPWVADSFKWAHSANPRGEYILNDFNLIAIPATRERFYQLVRTLLERGAPVGGLGIQAHEPREMWYPPDQVSATFDRLAELGLPLHITEFIPQSSGKAITGGWREGTWTEDAQAEFAEQFYTLAFGHPAIESITWWGLSDADIWLEGGGLLDERYQAKPVYNRLLQLIKSEWMTKSLERATDREGAVHFRGFHGEYQVNVSLPNGTVTAFRLHVRKDEANAWRFTL